MKANVDSKEILNSNVNFKQSDYYIKGDGVISYNVDYIGSSSASLSIEKQGPLDDMTVKVIGNLDDAEITIDGKMALKEVITGFLTIKTPIEGYKNVGLSFTHNAESDNLSSEGRVNLVDGEQYFGKVTLNRNKDTGLVDATLELNTPIAGAELTKISYTHTAQENDLTIYATAEYGNSKKFVYDFSASASPKIKFNIQINTPFEEYTDLAASADIEREWPQLSINAEINGGQDRRVTLTGSLDASRGIKGEMALATPLEGYSNVGLSFDHSGKWKSFNSEGRITYRDGQEISGNVFFKLRKPHFSAELNTPFSGHKNLKFEVQQTKTDAESTTTVYLKYGRGQVIQTDCVIVSLPKPGFELTVKTPFEEYKKLEASMSYVNSWPKLELNSKASAGQQNEFSLEANFDASDDISSLIAIKTPIEDFNNIGLSFSHIKSEDKFTSEGKILYMNNKDINGKFEFEKNQWRGYIVNAELNTPFENAEKTKVELTLDDTAPSYSAGYSFNYGNNVAYSANGKLNFNSAEAVDGSVEVVLPIEGVEFTKAEYTHKYDSARASGYVALTYGDSKTISGELQSSFAPYTDATVTVKTPFEGYEHIEGSAMYEVKDDKYGTSSSLKLGNGVLFSMKSDLDLSAEPFRASTQISTPYSDYRNMELVITHEGSTSDFHCTAFLSSPITDNINAAANMKYNTFTDMEASASIKSSFEGMDDLRAEIKNTEIGEQNKVKAVVGWTRNEQIEMDGMINRQKGWYQNKLNGEWSLSTPFKAVSKLAIEAERVEKAAESDHSLSLELNGEKLLDVDTQYTSKDKHQASVTFRKPRAMQYTVSGSSNAGLSEAEVMANWNRDETDSNVRVTASVNDQSDSYKTEHNVNIDLEYASRKMGVEHKLSSSDPITTSFGKIFWDSDSNSRVFYDMEIKDSSRNSKKIKEAFINLGLPTRTLGLSGSCSDDKVKRSGDITFSWDNKNADKQVALKGTITRGDKVKGDVTLSMPDIRKEIHIDGELMSQNGRILLDAKTDISYSKDSRKTLTLTSKLEDISDYYSHYNYSLAVGVSHPYTNVDIQMTSHLGCSDEKTTLGLSTDYLTARRQNKNLGLLAEINKLKRQLSVQITNPLSKMEYIAEEISKSPYQIRMLTRKDEVETFRSDFVMDKDQKSIELNMVEGSEGLKFTVGYPSLKEFRGEISRTSLYNPDTTEALLAVRLNTSRLMHTRLHWDPNMIQNAIQAIRTRLLADGIQEYQTLREVRAALSEEITGKYRDITTTFNEDVRPLVDELEKDFKYITQEIGDFSKAMEKAYKNNDFYLQEMGPALKERYDQMKEMLDGLKKEYNQETKKIIKSLNKALDEMLEYPITERYEQMISNGISAVSGQVEKALSVLESLLARTDAALASYRERMLQAQQKTQGDLYNNTYMTYISDNLAKLDVSPYMPSWKVPEEYTSAIYNAAGQVGSGVDYVLEAPGLHYVKHGVNEVYQQGVWAYTYWQLEKNIYEHSENILRLIEEIVWDELSQYAQEIQRLYYPITVWDPEHGEIQADFRLPVDVARLDEMPDLSPLVANYTRYLPDQGAWEFVYQYAPQMWSEEEELRSQLEQYRPSRQYKGMRRDRTSRKM
ncbi:hypothetical protein EGW08_004428 [Elysia chlorotica]|uniref:MHD domain-containing protein n=1 Tax=Elysia chlorotica TaxID=188477 RepID=A0A433U1W2_ELYCH|nr:hypothetical protein EGW08_004428 [Elysia chlorotica]